MSTTDTIETRLLQALSVEPSADGLRWLDQRVADLATRPAPAHRGAQARRFFLRPLALIAAFVLLTGAVAAALGLLDRIVESSGQPGWHVAWDNAERLDLTTTVDGVTIKVERAYADLNQVLVGFTVAGLDAPTDTTGASALQWAVEIEGPSGRSSELWATSLSGMGMEETGLSAVIQTWEGAVDAEAGTWVLTFTSVGYEGDGFVPGQCDVDSTEPECVNPPPNGMVNGTWRFEFQLPKPRGVLVPAGAQAVVGGGTLTLTELRISPTMIKALVGLRAADTTIVEWQWTGGVARHDGSTHPFQAGRHVTTDPAQQGPMGDVNELLTVAGTDAAAGTWELEFAEISYRTSAGEEVRVAGPWTLSVTVP